MIINEVLYRLFLIGLLWIGSITEHLTENRRYKTDKVGLFWGNSYNILYKFEVFINKLDVCLREKVENGKIKNKRVGRMILRKRMGVISNER